MKGLGSFKKIATALFTALIVLAIANTASADSLELTQQEKETYHKQYVEIIEEVNATYPNADLELLPLNEFGAQDWVEPEEFKQIATDRAGLKFVETESGFTTMAVTKTKSKSFDAKGAAASISVTASFNTRYDDAAKRQYFSSVNSVSSKSTSSGTWSQTGTTKSLQDGGRTYAITVGGTYTLNSIKSSHNLVVEFYCSSTGGVS